MKKILFVTSLIFSSLIVFGQRPAKIKPASQNSIEILRAKSNLSERTKNALCADTLRYPLLKEQTLTDSASGQFYTFSVWESDLEAISQTFLHAGAGVTISGVEFFGANFYDAAIPLGVAGGITVRARLMNVDAQNNPVGGALATGTAVINNTAPAFKYINFATPFTTVTATGNYAIVLDVTTLNGILDVFMNDAFSGQVQDENLSRFKSIYYPNSAGAYVSFPTLTTGDATNFSSDGVAPDPAYDFEPIVAPIVTYNITSTATVAADPVCLGIGQTLTGSAGPTNILSSRFYNYQVFEQYFLGAASDSTYFWDMSDGSPFIWATNSNYTYADSGSYDAYFVVLGGFWNSCLDFAVDAVTINKPSTAPTSITGTTSLCSGQTTTLTAAGGIAGSDVTYEWGTGSTVGSNIISGATAASYTTNALSATTTFWVRRKDPAPCSTTTTGATVTVTVNTPSTAPASISGTTAVCQGSTTTLTATGGVSGTGATYEWGTGAVGTNVIAGETLASLTTTALSSPVTYWVRRVDGAPCNTVTAEATVNITINALPTVFANTTDNSVCAGSPTTLNASGASTYSWNNGVGTGASVSVSPTTGTTYIVTGTDGNNCTNTASVAIAVTPTQDASFNYPSSTLCSSGANVTPNTTVSGGTFSSTTGLVFVNATTGEINVAGSIAGLYTVTYTNAGTCPGTATASINITSAQDATFNYPSTNVCSGGSNPSPVFGSGASAGTFTSTAGLNFVSTTTGVINLATSAPGTYTVFNDIAASGSCAAAQNSSSITINALPTATVTGGGSQCGNATPIDVTVTLTGAGPWDLVISDGAGTTNVSGQTTSPLVIPVTVSGTYTVTTVSENGCSASGTGSAAVTFSNGPTPTISPVNSLCSNAGAITLVASPSGGTFTGTGVTGTQFNPASATVGSNVVNYSVTDGSGCTGSTSVSIVVTAAPNVSITPVNDICNNATVVTLAATPAGGTFSGTGVTGNQFNPVQAPGNFNVYYSYTDGNGCTGNAGTAITVLASPTASLSAFSPICLQDGAITLSGGAPQNGVYSGTGVTGNQFNPTVSGAGTITIDYTYTASNGCSDNATNTITVNDCAGIDEIASINALIAPNPASDELTITINSELNNVVYSMVSEDGKVVIPATSINTTVTNINVNQLAEGLYFIQLSNANGIAVKKVIIK
jgi:hypothetical protein